MSQRHARKYEFGSEVPLDDIEPGTNLLVAGPSMGGVRRLALRLVTDGNDRGEGMLAVTTTKSGEKVRDECKRLCGSLDRSRFGIVDCVSQQQGSRRTPEYVETVSSPGDLTGIGIEFSGLYQRVHRNGNERVRAGLFSLSTLLMYAEFRTVSRFVHTLTGRISATDGLGVFLVDPTTHDERVVNTIAQLCDARIDVRESDGGGPELRVRGLPDQPNGWTTF